MIRACSARRQYLRSIGLVEDGGPLATVMLGRFLFGVAAIEVKMDVVYTCLVSVALIFKLHELCIITIFINLFVCIFFPEQLKAHIIWIRDGLVHCIFI